MPTVFGEVGTDRPTTIGDGGKRQWLYPASFNGGWFKRRTAVNVLLMVLFFALPWIEVGGHQAILLDIPHRKFAFFGTVLWPQDTVLLWLLLFTGIVGIFLITAQWGRIWCGWACPQTVFLEGLLRRVEWWIEGGPRKRQALDDGPWGWEKLWRKTAKHAAFLLISSHVANTFICYFAGTSTVIDMTLRAPADNPGWFVFMGSVNLLFYLDFAWFREQLCTIACPYGRWQSVLIDKHSMIVGYDHRRGEPQATAGQRRRKQEMDFGDCVSCSRCVQVCPTGIDIREGLQMECVNCTACMDACDEVMVKTKRPLGLIRYTSLAQLEGKPRVFLRPRTVAYGLLLAIAAGMLVATAAGRKQVEVQALRAPGSSVEVSNGWVSNHFRAKLVNKSDAPISVSLRPIEGYDLRVPMNPWPVPASQTATMEIFVRRLLDDYVTNERLELVFEMDGRELHRAEVTLLGPTHGARGGDRTTPAGQATP